MRLKLDQKDGENKPVTNKHKVAQRKFAKRAFNLKNLVKDIDRNQERTGPIAELAQAIKRQCGSPDDFLQNWMTQLKELQSNRKGSKDAVTESRQFANFYLRVTEALETDYDLSVLNDDEFNNLAACHLFFKILDNDPWVLRDILEMHGAFPDDVLIELVRDRGYQVLGAVGTLDAEQAINEME